MLDWLRILSNGCMGNFYFLQPRNLRIENINFTKSYLRFQPVCQNVFSATADR